MYTPPPPDGVGIGCPHGGGGQGVIGSGVGQVYPHGPLWDMWAAYSYILKELLSVKIDLGLSSDAGNTYNASMI